MGHLGIHSAAPIIYWCSNLLFSFSSRKLHKNYQILDQSNNSHICLMLSVYKSCHQPIKYGQQRNHILQDLTGLEIKISMKASKTKNWFQTGFQQ